MGIFNLSLVGRGKDSKGGSTNKNVIPQRYSNCDKKTKSSLSSSINKLSMLHKKNLWSPYDSYYATLDEDCKQILKSNKCSSTMKWQDVQE